MYGQNRWKGSFGHGFGFGGGFGRGSGMGPFGFGPNSSETGFPVMDELEMLKRYKDRLELHKRDLEAELNAVEKRISELEN